MLERLRNLKLDYRGWAFSALFCLVVVGSLSIGAKTVLAGHFGECPLVFNRCRSHGYATDVPYSGAGGLYVMSTGQVSGDAGLPAYDVNQFVDIIRNRLNDADPSSTDLYQDSTGAAMIVNTMLGHNGTDFSNRNQSVTNARARFGEWETRVRYYDSVGRVNWSLNGVSLPNGTINSLFDPPSGDNMFYRYGGDTQNLIVFTNPDGSQYMIKKNCGNPVGDLSPLEPQALPILSCGSLNPSSLDAGSPSVPIRVSFSNQAGSGDLSGANLAIGINTSPGQSFASVPFSPNALPGGSTAVSAPQTVNIPSAGNYTVTMTVSGGNTPGGTFNCSFPLSVVAKPYFKAFGGDIRSGGSFANSLGSCPPPTLGTGKILSFAKRDGSNTFTGGSSVQYAAQAFDLVDSFASDSGQARAQTGYPTFKRLTFANDASVGSYGGGFGAFVCADDYMQHSSGPLVSTLPPSAYYASQPGITTRIIDINLLPNGSYRSNPGENIYLVNTSSTPLVGKRTIYIDGRVRLAFFGGSTKTNFATQDLSAALTGSANDLKVIAREIYVDKQIERLDGVYIAQPSTLNNGNIYTCSSSTSYVSNGGNDGGLIPVGALYGECNKQLTVNGSMLGQRVYLLRTYGTLENGNTTERPGGVVRPCHNGASPASVCSGEIFKSNPDLYFYEPPGKRVLQIKSITPLPPQI